MLTSIDFYRAIRKTLEAKFSDIPVQIKDIKNPKPPCFYIKFVNSVSDQTAMEFESTSMSFDVIYFSESDNLLDLLTIQSGLEKLFQNPLIVTEFDNENINFVEINSVSTTLNEDDYIVNCTIDLEITQGMEQSQSERYELPEGYKGVPQGSKELMEEIELKNKGRK